jgi:hypothetical protein
VAVRRGVFGDQRSSDWEVDRAYLQLAFEARLAHYGTIPINAMTYAMRIFDRLYETTGSVEAKDHQPLCVDSEDAERFELIVGDIYRRRWTYMNRNLVEYRNKALIAIRAHIAGKDPQAEYDRFIKAGGKYFLDYPALCP